MPGAHYCTSQILSRKPRQLSTDLTGDNNDLKFTAKLKGHFGNTIKIAYVDPAAADAKIGVSVSGNHYCIACYRRE